MSELSTLTPESLRALVEREQTILREIAFRTSLSVRNAGFRPLLGDSLKRLSECSPEVRDQALTIVAGGSRQYLTPRQLDKLDSLLAERCVCHWFHHAVNLLALRAQQIVLPELIQHYESALDEEPRELPQSARMANTLKRLGPARKVARELARIHLTKSQESGRMPAYQRWLTVVSLLCVVQIPWDTPWFSLRILGTAAITPLALVAILRCLDFRQHVAWVGQLELWVIFVLMGAFRLLDICWASEWSHKEAATWTCFLLSGVFGAVGAVQEMRDRHRKLLRLSGIGRESSTPGDGPTCQS